jgi:VCBS repeat-containing protein
VLGTTVTVTAFDAISALGAAVIVNPDGTYSYDPTAAAAIQALNAGEMTTDTFSYTIADLLGATSTAIVTITLTGLDENLPGDFDGDGDYDCDDIDALVVEIVAALNNPAFDLTGDDLVDLADRDAWLAIAGAANLPSGNPYLLGDANLSGIVDFLDFNIWAANRFTNNPSYCSGDFDASGVIDFLDFNIWAAHRFQSSLGQAPPPTPDTTAHDPSPLLQPSPSLGPVVDNALRSLGAGIWRSQDDGASRRSIAKAEGAGGIEAAIDDIWASWA